METVNGYIVKFYRKIKEYGTNNSDFDFVTFMNFDGIKVKKVYNFADYQKLTIKFESPEKIDTYCSRQKLFIYNLDEDYSNINKDDCIFDNKPESSLFEYPVLAITIVNFKRNVKTNERIKDAEAIIKKFPNVKYKFFGSLSINDLVIVYRCKNFSDLFECNFHNLFPATDSFYSTYTIPCLSLVGANNWKENKSLGISIKSAIPPQAQYFNTNNNDQELFINGKKVYGLKEVIKYNIFGKYDIDIRGKINSSEEFLKNFESGLFSESKNGSNGLNRRTNTRFLFKCKPNKYENNGCDFEAINPDIELFKDKVSSLATQITEKSSLSSDFNHNLTRLWLRAYQLLLRGRDNPLLDDVSVAIEEYFNLAYKYINDVDYSESIVSGLTSLNTLIDNRDLNDFYEFENPHSNLMFSGCNTALLSAYSNMANIAFKRIKALNNNEGNKSYYSYITSDGYAEVSTRELFSENPDCYLINICIPTELMFEFKNLVCLILHEIGHCWEFGNETDRLNIFLGQALKQQLNDTDYIDGNLTYKQRNTIRQFVLNWTSKTDIVSSNLLMALTSALSYNCNMNLSAALIYANKILSNIQLFDTACREAIADIFMLTFLKITDSKLYLSVVVDYFNYKNIQFIEPIYNPEWSHSVFIRVVLALLFLLTEDLNRENSFKKIKEALINYMNEIDENASYQNRNKAEFVKQLLAFLIKDDKSSSVFYDCCDLYEAIFLQEGSITPKEFKDNCVLEDKDAIKVQKSFEKYLNTKGEASDKKFKAIIDFITEINEMH